MIFTGSVMMACAAEAADPAALAPQSRPWMKGFAMRSTSGSSANSAACRSSSGSVFTPNVTDTRPADSPSADRRPPPTPSPMATRFLSSRSRTGVSHRGGLSSVKGPTAGASPAAPGSFRAHAGRISLRRSTWAKLSSRSRPFIRTWIHPTFQSVWDFRMSWTPFPRMSALLATNVSSSPKCHRFFLALPSSELLSSESSRFELFRLGPRLDSARKSPSSVTFLVPPRPTSIRGFSDVSRPGSARLGTVAERTRTINLNCSVSSTARLNSGRWMLFATRCA
mmetsp:Transcript_47398/g.139962  ORF Transcript_47398/g.139962 Transcript_47398/m.139962 type:complete len:281 (-) Transcript_47398:131-973(-)